MSYTVEELYPISMSSNNSNGFIVSTHSSNTTAFYAFANIAVNSRITNGGQIGWIKIQLPKKECFNKISFNFDPTYFSIDFRIEASNDNVNFTILKSVTGNSLKNINLDLENQNEYLYYRIYTTKATYDYVDVLYVRFYKVFTVFEEKILLKSNNKTYSLKPNEQKYNLVMTSNTAPAPYVASASTSWSSTYYAWKAFDNTNTGESDCWASASGSTTGWIQMNYGTRNLFNKLRITSRYGTLAQTLESPKDFNILGSNDGINFDVLAEIKNQVDWRINETREFVFFGKIPYQYYRVDVKTNNGASTNCITIGKIEFSYIDIFTELPNVNTSNFINYGSSDVKFFNIVNINKNYILQDGISEDTDGLWKQDLNRKPLSVKFE